MLHSNIFRMYLSDPKLLGQISAYVRSGYPCACLCGCRARWKEQVCCVQCNRYITGNINACNCCMNVHPVTDDATCHMCHNEEYAASSGLGVRKPEEGESDDVRKDNKTRWRDELASTGTQTSRWSLQQHRLPPEGVESSTSVTERQARRRWLLHSIFESVSAFHTIGEQERKKEED